MEDYNTCFKLACEGEHAVRSGDITKGITYFERALDIQSSVVNSTSSVDATSPVNVALLSAICSQLGNAYYSIKDYKKALQLHNQDLLFSKAQNDKVQEAKAFANVSTTNSMLGQFTDAVETANRVLALSQELSDEALECRGLYNLGIAYLNQAISSNSSSNGHPNTSAHLIDAAHQFEKLLLLSDKRKDRILISLAIGNLGNTYFYLREYPKAIEYYARRLEISRSMDDRPSVRRSWSNLGSSFALLADYARSVDCFLSALKVARECGHRNAEAQHLFKLAQLEALRNNRDKSIEYHLQYTELVRSLGDTAGEQRSLHCLREIGAISALARLAATTHNPISFPLSSKQEIVEDGTDDTRTADENSPESLPDNNANLQETQSELADENCAPSIPENKSNLLEMQPRLVVTPCIPPRISISGISSSLLAAGNDDEFSDEDIDGFEDGSDETRTIDENCAPSSPGNNPNMQETQPGPSLLPAKNDGESSGEDIDDFFDRLYRFQAKGFDDQRAEPAVMRKWRSWDGQSRIPGSEHPETPQTVSIATNVASPHSMYSSLAQTTISSRGSTQKLAKTKGCRSNQPLAHTSEDSSNFVSGAVTSPTCNFSYQSPSLSSPMLSQLSTTSLFNDEKRPEKSNTFGNPIQSEPYEPVKTLDYKSLDGGQQQKNKLAADTNNNKNKSTGPKTTSTATAPQKNAPLSRRKQISTSNAMRASKSKLINLFTRTNFPRSSTNSSKNSPYSTLPSSDNRQI